MDTNGAIAMDPEMINSRVSREWDRIRITMNILPEEYDKSSRGYVLQQWIKAASAAAEYHCKKAGVLRGQNISLSASIIFLSSVSIVLATLVPRVDGGGTKAMILTYVVASVNAMVALFSGMISLLDPAGRRREHLIAENIWDTLGRDIAVCLRNEIADDDPSDYIIKVNEFQRRVDNATTLSPP